MKKSKHKRQKDIVTPKITVSLLWCILGIGIGLCTYISLYYQGNFLYPWISDYAHSYENVNILKRLIISYQDIAFLLTSPVLGIMALYFIYFMVSFILPSHRQKHISYKTQFLAIALSGLAIVISRCICSYTLDLHSSSYIDISRDRYCVENMYAIIKDIPYQLSLAYLGISIALRGGKISAVLALFIYCAFIYFTRIETSFYLLHLIDNGYIIDQNAIAINDIVVVTCIGFLRILNIPFNFILNTLLLTCFASAQLICTVLF